MLLPNSVETLQCWSWWPGAFFGIQEMQGCLQKTAAGTCFLSGKDKFSLTSRSVNKSFGPKKYEQKGCIFNCDRTWSYNSQLVAFFLGNKLTLGHYPPPQDSDPSRKKKDGICIVAIRIWVASKRNSGVSKLSRNSERQRGLRGKPGNCAGGLEDDLCTRCHNADFLGGVVFSLLEFCGGWELAYHLKTVFRANLFRLALGCNRPISSSSTVALEVARGMNHFLAKSLCLFKSEFCLHPPS